MEKERERGGRRRVGNGKDEASEAVEGRERVKEEKAGGGERRADGRERESRTRRRREG